jgi:1,4-dihydroxy-2-naphthoyl-CoA hydrolase
LPDYLGLEWLEARPGFMRGRFTVQKHHMAPNGFLHAASVIALADSACGYWLRHFQAGRSDGFHDD